LEVRATCRNRNRNRIGDSDTESESEPVFACGPDSVGIGGHTRAYPHRTSYSSGMAYRNSKSRKRTAFVPKIVFRAAVVGAGAIPVCVAFAAGCGGDRINAGDAGALDGQSGDEAHFGRDGVACFCFSDGNLPACVSVCGHDAGDASLDSPFRADGVADLAFSDVVDGLSVADIGFVDVLESGHSD
jgi:hypothetical protein